MKCACVGVCWEETRKDGRTSVVVAAGAVAAAAAQCSRFGGCGKKFKPFGRFRPFSAVFGGILRVFLDVSNYFYKELSLQSIR